MLLQVSCDRVLPDDPAQEAASQDQQVEEDSLDTQVKYSNIFI